ncbi:DNA repair protein RecO [bacterium]|nr:DNA repair protein RecO [bacterium]
METSRAEGIILRRQPVTESSLVVTWFTRELGKLKTLAKGGRRLKGPFAGKLDLFYRDEIVFLPSRRSDLHLLHDCFLMNANRPLRDSLATLVQASYAAELVDLATEREDPHPELFDLLAGTFAALAVGPDDGPLLVWMEIQVLALTGWAPPRRPQTATGRLLVALGEASLAGVRRVRLQPGQVQQLRDLLARFWVEHVGNRPRTTLPPP